MKNHQPLVVVGAVLIAMGIFSGQPALTVIGIMFLVGVKISRKFGSGPMDGSSNREGLMGVLQNAMVTRRTWTKGPYRVILMETGVRRMPVVRTMCLVLGLGLKEAVHLANIPEALLLDGISKNEAEYVKRSLEAQGANVEIMANSDFQPEVWQPSTYQPGTTPGTIKAPSPVAPTATPPAPPAVPQPVQSTPPPPTPITYAPPQPKPVTPAPTPRPQHRKPSPFSKAECDVVLVSVQDKSKAVEVEKVLVRMLRMGLKDAYVAVYAAPQVLKQQMPRLEAEALKKELETAGATIELR